MRPTEASYGATSGGQLAWESQGHPWPLLLKATAAVGKQAFALALIVIQIYFSSQKENIMSCDDRVIGLPKAALCEYTKAYVRYFPLLALVVSLMVTARTILHQGIFYRLLKRGAVLDFENSFPLSDPLFQILVGCFIQAVANFALDIISKRGLTLEEIKELTKKGSHGYQIAIFYLVPSAIFFVFLWASYDTEAHLVPLSKYFEADDAEARRILGKAPLIKEATAEKIVKDGSCFHDAFCQAEEVYNALIKEAEEVQASTAEEPQDMSRWRLVSALWSARLLLDPRLGDELSRRFRRMWYVFTAFTVAIMGFVFWFLTWQVVKDFMDVAEGQLPDLAGLVVEAALATLTAWLASGFMHNVLPPLRKPPVPKAA